MHVGQDGREPVESSWLDEVNAAMKLPPIKGRAVLDDMIAQRRRRAIDLRARVDADHEDDDRHQQAVFTLMATWVDDSITLLERARAHLDARAADDRIDPGGA